MSSKLRVTLLAHHGAHESEYEQGKAKFFRLLAPEYVEFVDEQPDVLFFLSGGSEQAAATLMDPEKFYVLIAFQEGNSYAAATEVKAYYNQHGVKSVLLDYDEPGTSEFVGAFYRATTALQRIKGQTMGLIGSVSDWLIASTIEPELLSTRLGMILKTIPWTDLPSYKEQPVSEDLLEAFPAESSSLLEETGKVYSLLQQCIEREQLDGITVECFSLVTAHAVTACLPLARLNARGIPAGCEGDVVSLIGMMLAKEVCHIIPWMVNTVKISGDRALFAHCTVAPTLLSDYTLRTHFETGKGTSIQGKFAADEITIFRVNNRLDRAFIAPGKVINRPTYDTACRTQIEVKIPQSAAQSLRERPLGNHHLILPGDHTALLALACQVAGMELQ